MFLLAGRRPAAAAIDADREARKARRFIAKSYHTTLTQLPIDPLLPEICATLRRSAALVLEAPPGAGKTTRVPPALLPMVRGEVWVLEPRRLAARLAARRVAEEMGEALGETVGYQVRFEQTSGPRTRLRFLTEGVLTRRFLSDPRLRDASVVVLDEFHERHLDSDLALALLRRLQRTERPDLKLVVMSATLEASPIAAYLGDCPVLRSEGRLFPMEVRYRPLTADPLEEQIRQAVEALPPDGDALVFLPGAGEIQRAMRALEPAAALRNWLVLPLYGDLSPEEQDRAVQPASQRKIILSTNVAESSVTIDGVRAVVDTGMARIASQSPWSGLPLLKIGRISQASATQRAGRAARQAPGTVIRLYPQEDLLRRPQRDTPEIARLDLSDLLLTVKSMGIGEWRELEWLDAPPESAVQAAAQLLTRLGAIDASARLTHTGKAMSQCPLPPRLARVVVEARSRNVGDDGALAAALLSLGARLPREVRHRTSSDVLALMEGSPHPPMTRRLVFAIRNAMGIGPQKRADENALLESILAGFPDRVARRRQGEELLLAGGGSAMIAPSSTVHDAQFLVAIDIEERQERGMPLVRIASRIDPSWLLDIDPDRVTERNGVEWHRGGARVESVHALLYDGLIIDESRGGRIDAEQAAALLSEKAREAGLVRFVDMEELQSFLTRLRFAAKHSKLREIPEADALDGLAELCQGKRSFAELEQACRDGGLIHYLTGKLGGDAARQLDHIAPTRLRMPSGRQGRIEYADGQPPRLSARLQEFFGMTETPRIANGQVPLVLLLLAPNMRPVQTTTDLAGFWQKWYPQVRKELMRKYPKHAWPEVPK
ncbi:MAG: ATP-dependent helicase HrpB [Acidobacteria bacterium]|nr:ATP-dependent helicase HrpB [Acidobacteriota bacterium]